jgi:hypothetical protein
MSEVKKLTTEELSSIKEIKQNYADLSFALGEIELQKSSLNKEKSRLLGLQDQLIEKEKTLAKQLQDKYGQGSINVETGEIS